MIPGITKAQREEERHTMQMLAWLIVASALAAIAALLLWRFWT